MKNKICKNCGSVIIKTGVSDYFICRDCESFLLNWDSFHDPFGYAKI